MAVNTVCSLLLASPRLIRAMVREGKVTRLHNRNCSATTAVEERLCMSPTREAPQGSGSPVQKLFSSLPPPQCFPLFRHRLAETQLCPHYFHLPLFSWTKTTYIKYYKDQLFAGWGDTDKSPRVYMLIHFSITCLRCSSANTIYITHNFSNGVSSLGSSIWLQMLLKIDRNNT